MSLIDQLKQQRGWSDEDVYRLQHPTVADVHAASLLRNAKEFIDCLHANRTKNVLIVPDYDTDGIMSGSILYASLIALGWTSVHLFAPSMETGYGLSVASLEDALYEMPNADVLITTDNGIVAYDGVAEAKRRGLIVLVTDHHPGAQLEPNADVIVNPNAYYDTTYPFKDICGGEVIFKLMQYYAEVYGTPEQKYNIDMLYPFAGISAVADMMSMTDENRFYVKATVEFLKAFQGVDMQTSPLEYRRVFYGLWAMLRVLDVAGKLRNGIDADTIGFYLSPMLNSSRRVLGTSRRAFEIFLQDDIGTAMERATDIMEINELRKKRSRELGADALIKYEKRKQFDYTIMVIDAPIGFAGLVSGHLTSHLDLPTIVFSNSQDTRGVLDYNDVITDEKIHGSGRSPEWFSVRNAMIEIENEHPDWIVGWGGHDHALGCEIYSKHLNAFRQEWANIVSREYLRAQDMESQTVTSDDVLLLTDETPDEIQAYLDFVDSLQPFGTNFPRPVVGYDVVVGSFRGMREMGSENQHLKISTEKFDLLIWNYRDKPGISKLMNASRGSQVRVIGTPGVNEWNGHLTSQIIVDKIV